MAQARRPRHQLHRACRRAARHRPQGGGAGAAAQPGRRLRRRRHVPRLRRGVRAARGPEVGQGPGGRRRHGRRRRLPGGRHLRPVLAGHLDRRARRQRASIPARPGTTSTRRRTASGCRSAPSSSASTPSWWRSWGSPRPGCPSSTTARAGPILRERFAAAIASRTRDEWERDLRRQRRLRRPGAGDGRGGEPPPQRRARHLRAARRRPAAGAGAALLAHRAEMGAPGAAAAPTARRSSRTGALPPPRSPS